VGADYSRNLGRCSRAPADRLKQIAPATLSATGNLYGNLLDYVISAALIFYVLTIAGLFCFGGNSLMLERPYKAFGYPIVPILYIIGATTILLVLFVYQTATTWPGLLIVISGVPIYFFWNLRGKNHRRE